MVTYNEKLEKELLQIIKANPCNYIQVLKSNGFRGRYLNRQYLRDYIYSCTSLLEDTFDFQYSLKTRLFWTINHIEDWTDLRVCCQYDHNPIKNWNITSLEFGYKKTCCNECSRKLAYKTSGDKLEAKYGNGIRNSYQIPEVKQSIAKQQKEIDLKKKATRLKNFGDPNFNNTKQACATKIEKYGSVWNLEKCEETWEKKYGVRNPMQNIEIAERQKSAAYIYDNQKFDSSFEFYYYIYLKDHKINFIFHPDEPKLWYQKKDMSWHRYYPDFILTDTGQIVETKGNNAFDNEGNPIKNGWDDWTEKYQCMINNNVKILLQEDIKEFKAYVEKQYGKDFHLKFKVEIL